jgi:hypothetical protein
MIKRPRQEIKNINKKTKGNEHGNLNPHQGRGKSSTLQPQRFGKRPINSTIEQGKLKSIIGLMAR